ncbi:aminotransferase class V-fold PLP-dependent enzyme [bacterium]|jgi:Cysteine sulfinate desulfinase/cysteine desulfurase and related enzymes|nr:MAG: aminotransferase class V-fold PLP-dependent enzyme [bacterium]
MSGKEVYLDSCKTSRMAPEVLHAMMPYLTDKYWYPGSFTSIGTEIAEVIEQGQETVAHSMNAKSEEITFTSGGTDANNIAIQGILQANKEKGKHFICSTVSHPSVLAIFQGMEKQGFEGTYISANRDGHLNLDELEAAIRPDTILAAFTQVNHILGTIQNSKAIRNILDQADHKVYLFMDSCEAYTKIPLDVEELGIDSLSISVHKFNGPKGMGILYVKKGTEIVPTQFGITRLYKLKPGVINVPGIVGTAKAVEMAFTDFDKTIERYRELQKLLYDEIMKRIPDAVLNGPPLGERSPAHLNVTFRYIEGEAIMMMLDFDNIHVETGSACSSQNLQPNYILMNTGRTHEESHGSVRFTLDRFVTKEDILKTVDALEKTAKELRRRSPLGKKEQ